MMNEQVKVDFNMCFAVPEGMCRYPGCSKMATHIVSDGRYAFNNNLCPTGKGVVCQDHICVCTKDRDLYGLAPVCSPDTPISWKALVHFVICAACEKLVFIRKDENVGQSSISAWVRS